MSLCPCKKRIWWVETDELSFSSQEDFGNFQGGRFYIYDTPIFILPAGKFPLTTEKRSGILLPELSYSNKNGFDLNRLQTLDFLKCRIQCKLLVHKNLNNSSNHINNFNKY